MKINHIRNDTIEGFYQKLSDSFGFNLSPQWQHPWSYCVLKSLPYSPIFKVLNIADWTVLCRIKLKCYLSMYLAINVMTILLQFHDLGYDYDIYDIRTRCFHRAGQRGVIGRSVGTDYDFLHSSASHQQPGSVSSCTPNTNLQKRNILSSINEEYFHTIYLLPWDIQSSC